MGAIFNSKAFMDSLGDDAELAAELLEAYIEDSPMRSEKLGEALQTNDSSMAAKAAHSLKGMSGVVRAQALVEMALDMEATAKDGDLARVRAVYEAFRGTLESALDEMRTFMSTL